MDSAGLGRWGLTPTAPAATVAVASSATFGDTGQPRRGRGTGFTQLSALAPVFVPASRSSDSVMVTEAQIDSNPVPVAELFTGFYCNARSLRNNLAELHETLYSGKYKIICFTETWLCSNFSDAQLDPKGVFNIYRKDRKSQRPAGGVCIFISIQVHSIISEICCSEYEDTEIVSVNILTSASTHITLICVYIPPNLSLDVFNRSILCLEKICSLDRIQILVGDFNLPGIDWETMTSPEDAKNKQFLDFCLLHGFNQYVSVPTRLLNILDLVLCNERMLISDLQVGVPFGLSDHDSIIFSVTIVNSVSKQESRPDRTLNWAKTNWNAFTDFCRSIDWDELIDDSMGVDELWTALTTILKHGIRNFVPFRENMSFIPRRKHQSKRIIKHKARKLKLWKKLKKSKSVKNKKKYRNAAKILKAETASEYKQIELKIINSNDLSNFYKHVNRNTVHKTGIGPLKTPSGSFELDDGKKAQILNDYFTSICTIDDGILPPLGPLPYPQPVSSYLDNISFRTATIFKILKSVKKKISSGPDGIPSILFNHLASSLAYPLFLIFNLIMQKGEVPNIWKQAIVIPIFKKGVSSDPKNYRPISLTCAGSKIFESSVKPFLVTFLEEKKLLSRDQHGFRAKHSTCLNLLESLNDWTKQLDSKKEVFVAHIDFARAFDSVSLPKLLYKLQNAGIVGNVLSCIKSMLFDRSQQVKVGVSLSNPKAVTSGVPQGSVLGPVFFIFFINDITQMAVPPSIPKLYADDLKVYSSTVNDNDGKAFQGTLDKITSWSEIWQLPISKEKSKWLLLTNKNKKSPHSDCKFELAGITLPRVKEVLDLGVNFNSRLNFSNHVDITIAKAKQRLFLLKKSFKSRNADTLLLGFKTYIIPILDYCAQVWSPQDSKDKRRIESIQRMFTKRLIGYNGLNYPERLEKAGLHTLELRRLHADLCLCYNIVHKNLETEIGNYFQIDNTCKTRGHTWKLKTSVPRLDTRMHYFSCRTINAWNALSQTTVDSCSIASFKSNLKTESLDNFVTIHY